MTASLTTPKQDSSPIIGRAHVAIWLGLAALTTGQASAQQVALSLSSGSTTPGSSVALSVSMTSSGGALPTSLQWTMSYPTGVTGVSVVAGSSAIAAGKSVSCSGTPVTCIVFGLNTT